jgi:mannose/fructose/N-acetylgalactosamine-specific phosphotransferase system component IIC
MALVLAGCVNSATNSPPQPSFAGIVGTPFLIAFKIPVCAATIAMGGPIAGAAALTATGPDANYAEVSVLRAVDNGLNQNCGPPYLVTP